MSGRVEKSVKNMKVGMIFYILSFLLAFFSRKIFLDCLGADFIGLTGTLGEILSFLNIAELGLSSTIVYFLYKPLLYDNRREICKITSMLSYLYRIVGFVILFGGITVSLFFPLMFKDVSLDLPLIYFTFYTFLASSVVGYIFNYRMLILSANQQQYLVDMYMQSMSILQGITQIILALVYKNLYLWIFVQFLFSLLGCILLNYRINKYYPWLKTNLTAGKLALKDYPEIIVKTKQLFVQCIKEFLITRCDQIMIFAYVSLKMVAYYGNYTMIINKVVLVINILFNGVKAGVGNLVAEGDDHNTMKIFWELTSLRTFFTGLLIFPTTLFIKPFIVCWLGEEYVLDDTIVYLLVTYFFFALMYNVVSMFIFAYGLFRDVWASFVELILSFGGMLLLGPFYGITGLLTAKIVYYIFVMSWKPYFLFKEGFHKSVFVFWRGMLKYILIFIIFMLITLFVKIAIVDGMDCSWLNLIIYSIIVCSLILISYFVSLLIFTDGMKYFLSRYPRVYTVIKRFIPFC